VAHIIIVLQTDAFSSHFYFSATEAHDDDGLPHTLEHLVFMGSEDFPYKV
jgi:Zn-dependent M16 (insulinase) family peptidase